MKIIPAIDLIDGRCVRLIQGDFSRSEQYRLSPLEQALVFESHGIRYLHLVDLDGAKSGSVQHWSVLEQIAASTSLSIDFSGGIRTSDDVHRALDCGAAKVAIGSMAVKDPEVFALLLERFGPERIVLSADVKDKLLAVQGWQEHSDIALLPFLATWYARGIRELICTDISRDGMLQGPATALYGSILESLPVQLIASGGVSGIEDLGQLRAAGCSGAIIGKALYEGNIALEQLSGLC